MLSEDSFQYALENTRVVVAPRRRLETFGTSLLDYYLVTEDMDNAHLTRVREGRIEAERLQIVAPRHFAKLLVEGFGERAEAFADFVSANASRFAFLKYGFRFRKNELRTYDVHEPAEAVLAKIEAGVKAKDAGLSVVLHGIDDAWEVCLLKFMVDFVQQSAPGQMDEMRRRGLLGGGDQSDF
jgi:hypothetical protein